MNNDQTEIDDAQFAASENAAADNLPAVVQPMPVGQVVMPDQPPEPARTSEQARQVALNAALTAGLERASTLHLTQRENEQLAEPFPDDAFELGAAGKPGLIYCNHVQLRERLNTVLGFGEARFLRTTKPTTTEYTVKGKYGPRKAIRLFFEGALLVRGVLVGEAVGDSSYFPDNESQTETDCLEAAKSAAFRRACKDFGVGLQAWDPKWVSGWKRRHPRALLDAYKKANRTPDGEDALIISELQAAPTAPPQAPAQAPAPKPAAPAPAPKPTEETPEQRRQRWIALCRAAASGMDGPAEVVLEDLGLIEKMTKLEDYPTEKLPATRQEADSVLAAIRIKAAKWDFGKADEALPGAPEPPAQRERGPGESEISGFVAVVTEKATAKGGTKFGICITEQPDQREGGTWVNTFDSDDGAKLQGLKGQGVTLTVTEDKYGWKLVKHAIRQA